MNNAGLNGGRGTQGNERNRINQGHVQSDQPEGAASQREVQPGRPSSDSSTSTTQHLSSTPLAPFALPTISAARQSASSLMDAVFGDDNEPASANPSPLTTSSTPHASTTSPRPEVAATPPIQFKRKSRNGFVRTSSGRSQAGSDVLSDGESRLNEGVDEMVELQKRGEVVDELQKKVDRRKSQLPQLESELALLEAQIKAAEERLAKVQESSQPQAAQSQEAGRHTK